MMHRNKSVNVHNFSMVPKADIPRSSFRMQHVHKTSFDGGDLVPMYVDEMLPGDTFNLRMTAFCRLATPIFPTMDNLHLETFFFFVPCRLVWNNWQRFMGERDPDPDSSISYLVPTSNPAGAGYAVGSLQDHFGLGVAGQVAGGYDHNNLPLRAYNLIWNEWFRDQNLQDSVVVDKDDGPDGPSSYVMLKRGKRHDYFTSCLPFAQKGTAVNVPLGTSAPVVGVDGQAIGFEENLGAGALNFLDSTTGGQVVSWANNAGSTANVSLSPNPANSGVIADLSLATGATVNLLRTSFQIQRLLERDARGGTRYIELVRAHFGVVSPDARLQRPEYLGGGSTPIVINPIAQTSATAVSGSDTPQGNLAAVGTGLAHGHGFTYSATEHGYVIGLVNARADITYQQGLRKLWSRSTRYDFYFPVFANLGEQAVLNKEIYLTGSGVQDSAVFGYQERWAEYRYFPSLTTSLMRSTAANTIDPWHYAAEFGALPVLNNDFIQDSTESVVARATAVGVEAEGQQFLLDAFFDCRAARPMPLYSVPGLIDHF